MQIHFDFYQHEALARPFFELQRLIFPGLDLEWARDNELLAPEVVPFGLFEDGRALSILNATSAEIVLGDRSIQAVQLGTVATHPDFRHRGYSRCLISEVFKRYRDSAEVVFLYANETVLDFYPRFGFRRVQETQFSIPLRRSNADKFRKLDPGQATDRELIFDRLDHRIPLSRACGVADYRILAKWYATTFFTGSLWYGESSDVLLVASIEGSRLVIQDVVTTRQMPDFFIHLSWPNADEAVVQFVPDQFAGSFLSSPIPEGDALFVRGDLPDDQPIRIPLLAHT